MATNPQSGGGPATSPGQIVPAAASAEDVTRYIRLATDVLRDTAGRSLLARCAATVGGDAAALDQMWKELESEWQVVAKGIAGIDPQLADRVENAASHADEYMSLIRFALVAELDRITADMAIGRFLAAEPVAAHVDSLKGVEIPHQLAIGTRLKRKRSANKKNHKHDFGIVMHVAPGAPMAIAALWMRDADALEVQVYKGADELGKLASYKNSFLGAAEKAPIPQQATFEILKTTWYASAPILTRQPLLAARAAPRWAAGLLLRAGLHASDKAAHRDPVLDKVCFLRRGPERPNLVRVFQ